MEHNTFQALLGYKSAMAQIQLMLAKGLVTSKEFAIIETKLCQIYCINFDSLYREKDWITQDFRGNMAPIKEAV